MMTTRALSGRSAMFVSSSPGQIIGDLVVIALVCGEDVLFQREAGGCIDRAQREARRVLIQRFPEKEAAAFGAESSAGASAGEVPFDRSADRECIARHIGRGPDPARLPAAERAVAH